jgi:GNAT superfamily N-acetyltransferase
MAIAQVQDKRPIEVRGAEPADRSAILALMAPLGWSGDERFESLFDWKHEQNPFGRSPAWVAVDDGEVVGFRTFLRWEHITLSGEVLRAVRAVDTATRSSHQGRGIFRRLTLQALDDLRAQGVAFVFNTPNDQSLPGYLKMGWSPVGRLRVGVRVRSVVSAARMARARVPADLWSATAHGGRPASDVLADPQLPDLLASVQRSAGLTTNRTPGYLRWRYGFAPLAYRAVTLGDTVGNGLAIYRLRRRGPALECALCEFLVPEGDPRARRALARSAACACGADYLIRLGGPPVDRIGFVRAPGQGPLLTWYDLSTNAPGRHLEEWTLTLGDVELF